MVKTYAIESCDASCTPATFLDYQIRYCVRKHQQAPPQQQPAPMAVELPPGQAESPSVREELRACLRDSSLQKRLPSRDAWRLNVEQRRAVKALIHVLTLVSAGPGTGKTELWWLASRISSRWAWPPRSSSACKM